MADEAQGATVSGGVLGVFPAEAVARCMRLLVAVAAVYGLLWFVGFQKLFHDDGEGVAALLQIIGTLYSVLYAFATYVIWGQFTAVENGILRESGALKDLLLFSGRLRDVGRDPIVRAVKNYARAVAEEEWGSLASGMKSEKTDRLFNEVIANVTAINSQDETESLLYERLLEIANQASAHRDERLALSLKRMPRTLLVFVTVTASTILFLLLFYPFRNPALGIISMAVTSMLLFFAHFVLTDLDNPFQGTWNVHPDPFGELVTKFR